MTKSNEIHQCPLMLVHYIVDFDASSITEYAERVVNPTTREPSKDSNQDRPSVGYIASNL